MECQTNCSCEPGSARGTLIRGLTCCFARAGANTGSRVLHEQWTRCESIGACRQLLHREPPPPASVFPGHGRGSGSTFPAATKTTALRATPKIIGETTLELAKNDQAECHHVAHHQIQDESRLSHRLEEGCMYADLSNDVCGSAADEEDCSLKTRHFCNVRLAFESACAGDHPCPQRLSCRAPGSGRFYEVNR